MSEDKQLPLPMEVPEEKITKFRSRKRVTKRRKNPGIELRFMVEGELFGTIKIPDRWSLSKYRTCEKIFVSGYLTKEGMPGYRYDIWLERPLTRESG